MRAIEAEFAACGLTTHLTDARAGLDLSAILSPSGKREAEIWVDENGYVEVRYWSPPGASPPEIAATALRALRAITGAVPQPRAFSAGLPPSASASWGRGLAPIPLGLTADKSDPRQGWRCSSRAPVPTACRGSSVARPRAFRDR